MAADSYTAVATIGKSNDAPELSSCQKDMKALKGIVCSGINVLMVFVPIGLMSRRMGWNSAVIFSTNFMAIIPLAAVLGAATESLAEHTGQTIGGLVNATFGNAVEMIITIDAIKKGLCSVVQAGLIGSVLSNLLLVLGMSFIASGLVRSQHSFNKDGAGANTSCLLVAAIGVVIPTLFAGSETEASIQKPKEQREQEIVLISRICAVIMAAVYCFFLFFQLHTHQHHFDDVVDETVVDAAASAQAVEKTTSLNDRMSASMAGVAPPEEDNEVEGVLSPFTSVLVLLGATCIISALSELMVDSIESVSEDFGLPKSFIGLILLPIVGNAAEHMTAVTSAFKGKMDLAIGVAVGSSTQISLLVVPFAIIMGWVFDQPMDLNFGIFYAGTFMMTVFLVGSVLQDGSSNWLEGLMLIATYVMIAVICWFQDEPSAE